MHSVWVTIPYYGPCKMAITQLQGRFRPWKRQYYEKRFLPAYSTALRAPQTRGGKNFLFFQNSIRRSLKNGRGGSSLRIVLEFFHWVCRHDQLWARFCQQCLMGMTVETPWICPECRTEQHQQPEQLAWNFYLEKMVEKFIESRKNICSTHNLPKKLRKYFHRFITFDMTPILFQCIISRLLKTWSKPLSRMQRSCNVRWSISWWLWCYESRWIWKRFEWSIDKTGPAVHDNHRYFEYEKRSFHRIVS